MHPKQISAMQDEKPPLQLIERPYLPYQLTPEEMSFIPSQMCHVFFPYSEPPVPNTTWWRAHKAHVLMMQPLARIGYDEKAKRPVPEYAGLPYGARPRRILSILNNIVKTRRERIIEIGKASWFIKNLLRQDANGKEIARFRDTILRLAHTNITLAYDPGFFERNPGYPEMSNESFSIIGDYAMWQEDDLKPGRKDADFKGIIKFSQSYMNILEEHAVPLDENALFELKNSALQIDIYNWLAYRLQYLKGDMLISWGSLKDQFGHAYADFDSFKKEFRKHLGIVIKKAYRHANVKDAGVNGLILKPSRAPISKKLHVVTGCLKPEHIPLFTGEKQIFSIEGKRISSKPEGGDPQAVGEILGAMLNNQTKKAAKDGAE